ncbi:WD40-repeat-containing domain protein [Irpex lacteus]|nr:WD40-repeat-containing domain protein [Irpex lacteus]
MPLRYVEQTRLHGGHTQGISCLAFNHNGSLLASGSLDGSICAWDSEDVGKPLYTWAGTSPVLCLEWREPGCGDSIFCGLQNGSVLSLRISKRQIELYGFWAYGYPVERLAAHKDYLAVGAQKQASVWRVMEEGVEQPQAGKLLFVAYMYHGVVIIDSETWSRVRSIPTSGCIASVSPNGEFFAVSNPPARFDVYRIDGQPDSHTPVRVLVDESDADLPESPTPVVFVHDGHALLTGSSTGTPKLWDAGKGILHHRIHVQAGKRILAVAASFSINEEDPAMDEFKIALGLLDTTSSESEIVMCAAVPYDEPVHALRSWSRKTRTAVSRITAFYSFLLTSEL